jgi:hypothetical protein
LPPDENNHNVSGALARLGFFRSAESPSKARVEAAAQAMALHGGAT